MTGLPPGAAGNELRTPEASIVPPYFGTAHLGTPRGIMHGATVASTTVGPVLCHRVTTWPTRTRSR